MASIDTIRDSNGRAVKFRARFRSPDGGSRTKTFSRRVDAERFLTATEHRKLSGSYVEPSLGRMTVGQYSATWLERQHWRDSTNVTVEVLLRRHILPVLGERRLATLTRSDVEAWGKGLSLAPASVANARQQLGALLRSAVDDGLIPRNPAVGARMPKADGAPVRALTPEQVDALTAAASPLMGAAIMLGLGAGLRQGEACGLTLGSVDFLRRSLRVERQLVTVAGRAPVLGPPKTASSLRTVPLTDEVLETLSEFKRVYGTGVHELILHDNGRPIARGRWGSLWQAMAKSAGVPGVRFHDLRHTFASELLSNGVSIAAVSAWLGHSSPTITLSTYAHMMPVDEDRGRAVISAALGRLVSNPCYEATAEGL